MKLLLTGASGMVGRNIQCHSNANEYQLLTPNSDELNLLNSTQVKDYLQKHLPDFVVHAAGLVGGIQDNIKRPFEFLHQNSIMGLHLVETMRELGLPNLINLGSSCMYPKNYKNPLKEEYILEAALEPTNEGYALAKILTAKACEYASNENCDLNYKTLIPCNLYGPWDSFKSQKSHMIPAVIRKIHEAKTDGNKKVEIWGDGTARREFMYVEDLADFVFFVLPKVSEIPQYMNIGLGYDYSINEYYQEIKKVLGYEGDFFHNLDKPVGMKQKMVDISKMEALGWKAKFNLNQGLEKTYHFYKTKVLEND